MWSWRKKSVECFGGVLFAGSLPPRPHELSHLQRLDVKITPLPSAPNAHWCLRLDHPQRGSADMVAFRDIKPPPGFLVDLSPALLPDERDTFHRAGCMVSVRMNGAPQDVLRDRKRLLWYLRAAMGHDGLGAVDLVSQNLWSRAALDDELAHDADLDVEALYCMHLVTEGDDRNVAWLHTHGLGELGFFDFDILDPAPDVHRREVPRAMAFAILEGRASAGQTCTLWAPDGQVRLVPAAEFHRRARPADAARRLDADDGHNTNRVVLCEPQRGFWARFSSRPRPARWLSTEGGDEGLVFYSNEATELSALRARNTLQRFLEAGRELADLKCPMIAKIGYVVDGGGPTEREHLWFTVHDIRDGRIDATLESEPFHIARMTRGQRAWHDVENLTDWAIVTPFGMATPRHMRPLRLTRANRDRVLEYLAQKKQAQSAKD